MRKHHLLLPVLALTVVLGSCSSGGDEEVPADATGQQPVPAQPANPSASAPAPATPPGAAPAPGADAPAANAEAGAEEEPSDLLTGARVNPVFIQSTDPDARRIANKEGRNDPFSDFSFNVTGVTFVPDPPAEPTPPQAVPPVSPVTPTPPATPPAAQTSTPNTSTPDTNATLATLGSQGNSSGLPSLDFSPVLPDLPTADLAEGTEVTGVVTLNGVDNIMVKAPNEDYSRYVQVGDLIADGQVKVKRVDFRRNSPVVVLEQFGIEVYKEIDDVLLADRDSSPAPEAEASEG